MLKHEWAFHKGLDKVIQVTLTVYMDPATTYSVRRTIGEEEYRVPVYRTAFLQQMVDDLMRYIGREFIRLPKEPSA